MATHGPSYGLSRECAMKSQAKFSIEKAQECLVWIEEVTGVKMELEIKDPVDFGNQLKDGTTLCKLINEIVPGAIKKINTMNAPFKQRENIEMYLKACSAYGLKEQDLFQVNDLYEAKNLYMIVDNLYSLGGMSQKKSWEGPVLGVKIANENKRNFDEETLKAGKNLIGLQYGTNKCASQAGMTAYGAPRQIRSEDMEPIGKDVIGLQSGTNKVASQAGMTAYGTGRQIRSEDMDPVGKNVIGLQYGTNKVASQAGMTAYGTGRQIRSEDMIKENGEHNRT